MSHVYPDPIQGPNSPVAKSFPYQPAFPLGPTAGTMKPMQDGTLIVTHYGMQSGITIRDYFAAAIMQGLMSSQYQVDDPYPIYAYKIADAMIKAREVKP